VMALQRGAVEANPLVAPFTQSPAMFAAFTVAKCAVLYLAGKSLNLRKTVDLLVFTILLAIFLHATAINVMNWWVGG
jgi:diacylglycerol kinase